MSIDISIGGKPEGTVLIGLFGEDVPKTVKNFLTFATTGYQGYSYLGTKFHRVIERFMVQGKQFTTFFCNFLKGSFSISQKRNVFVISPMASGVEILNFVINNDLYIILYFSMVLQVVMLYMGMEKGQSQSMEQHFLMKILIMDILHLVLSVWQIMVKN